MRKRLRRHLLIITVILLALALTAAAGAVMRRVLTGNHQTDTEHTLYYYSKSILLQLQGALNEADPLAQTAKTVKGADASWFEPAAAPLMEREEVRYVFLFYGDTMICALPKAEYGSQVGQNLKDFSYIYTLAKVTKQLVVEGPVSLGGAENGREVFLFLQPFLEDNAYLGEVVVALDRDYVLKQLDLDTLTVQGYDYELWRVHPQNGSKEVVAVSRENVDFSRAVKTTFYLPTEWNLSIQPQDGWISPGHAAGILVACCLLAALLIGFGFTLGGFLHRSKSLKRVSIIDQPTGMYNKMSFLPALDRWASMQETDIALFYLVYEGADQLSQLMNFEENAVFLQGLLGRLQNFIQRPFLAGRFGEGQFVVAVREEMSELQMENFAKGLSLELLLKTRLGKEKIFLLPHCQQALWKHGQVRAKDRLLSLIGAYYQKRTAESPVQMLTQKCRQLADGKSDVTFDEYTDLEMMELSKAFNQYRKKVEQLAYFDPVFHVGNRPKYLRDAAMLISYDKKRHFSLFCIDLCAFNQYNHLFSAAVGDSILHEVIHRLSRQFGNHLYRINGDVFLGISLSGGNVENLAEKIQSLFKEPVIAGKTTFTLQVRISICRYPENGNHPEVLLDRIQSALRYAKESGRDVICYNEELDEIIRSESDILRRLKDAIQQKTLEVWYQPILHIESGRFTAAEALTRLPDGEGGYFPAGQVIALAERSGIVEQLGDYVLDRACRFLREHGQSLGISRMGVNLSVQQLLVRNSADHLLDIIRTSGADPHQITLEITESILIQSMERASITLEKLRQSGVHIALDDFGVGYSSLNYLSNLPVDVIKTDRSLTLQIPTNPKQEALLHAIVEMAKINSLMIVSEGIESKEEQERIAASGVQYIQGFYYAKPMRQEELFQFLD